MRRFPALPIALLRFDHKGTKNRIGRIMRSLAAMLVLDQSRDVLEPGKQRLSLTHILEF